jgi:hypothetical protein
MIAIRQKSLFVVVKLLARFGCVFEVRTLDDGVDRTGFLAQPAIDAFDHIDIVASGTASAIVAARAGLDRDGLRRADRRSVLGEQAIASGLLGFGGICLKSAKASRQTMFGKPLHQLGDLGH